MRECALEAISQLRVVKIKEVEHRRVYGSQITSLKLFFTKHRESIKADPTLKKLLPRARKDFFRLRDKELETLTAVTHIHGLFIGFVTLISKSEEVRKKEEKLYKRKKWDPSMRDDAIALSGVLVDHPAADAADCALGIMDDLVETIKRIDEQNKIFIAASQAEKEEGVIFERTFDAMSDGCKKLVQERHDDYEHFGEMINYQKEEIYKVYFKESYSGVDELNDHLRNVLDSLNLFCKLALYNPAYMSSFCAGRAFLVRDGDNNRLKDFLLSIFKNNSKMIWDPDTRKVEFFRDGNSAITKQQSKDTAAYLLKMRRGADHLVKKLLEDLWSDPLSLLADVHSIEENMTTGKKAVAPEFKWVMTDEGRCAFIDVIHEGIEEKRRENLIDGKKHTWY